MKKQIFFILALPFIFQFCFCQNASRQENLMQLENGINLHNLAESEADLNAKKDYIIEGKRILKPLSREIPLAKAYYGSLITIESSYFYRQGRLIKSLECLNTGTALIDEAVKSDSENTDIRFLRIGNSYDLSRSSPKNRMKQMHEDIDFLENRHSTLSPLEESWLELYKGLFYIESNNTNAARSAFWQCINAAPGSLPAEKAQIKLKEIF